MTNVGVSRSKRNMKIVLCKKVKDRKSVRVNGRQFGLWKSKAENTESSIGRVPEGAYSWRPVGNVDRGEAVDVFFFFFRGFAL